MAAVEDPIEEFNAGYGTRFRVADDPGRFGFIPEYPSRAQAEARLQELRTAGLHR
ncbi:hypothetical protein ACFTXJ_14460 [Streptomyces zhihengii]|uniref:hypothetical protein n=1 Tax=Streptomyces zhihengii TaxID=1818004 RepID=UPI003641532A